MSHPVSGHVYRYDGKRRSVWRAKYRLPDGRQVKKTLGPAWTSRGRPPAGYFTRRTAEAWLRATLASAAAGTLPGMVRTRATVADACAEYLRYIEQDRQRKPSTLRDYDSIFRNHVLPHLGSVPLEDLTPERVERWAAHEIDPDRRLANRTREKTITGFHGVMERARKLYRLPTNPVADVEHLEPMLDATQRELARAGIDELPEVVLADAGYWHGEQMQRIVDRGIQVLIPPDTSRRRATRRNWDGGRYDEMRRVLATDRGGELYRKRQPMIEPAFAQMKFNRGLDRFRRRGRGAVRAKWRLITATHNLLKLHRHALAAA